MLQSPSRTAQRPQVKLEFDEGITVGQALAAVEEGAGVPRSRQCIVVTGETAATHRELQTNTPHRRFGRYGHVTVLESRSVSE